MALSRIWSAFIIVAILVASAKSIFAGDSTIFSRMVVGKADEAYDTVRYKLVGSPEKEGNITTDRFTKYLAEFAYVLADSIHQPSVIIAGNESTDSVNLFRHLYPGIKVYNYRSLQPKLIKK